MAFRRKRSAEAIALREKGMAYKDIAEKMGITVSWAWTLVDDPNCDKHRVRNKKYEAKKNGAIPRPYDPALTTAGKAGIDRIILCACGRPLTYAEEPMAFACPFLWSSKVLRWRIGLTTDADGILLHPRAVEGEHVTCLPIEALNPCFRISRKAQRWRAGDFTTGPNKAVVRG